MENCLWCNSSYEIHSPFYPYCSQKCDQERLSRIKNQKKLAQVSSENLFYSRECSECAEVVKKKAKLCKECGFEFPDRQEQLEYLKSWEQRAAKFGLKPWQTKEIEQEEFNLSPEGLEEKKSRKRQELSRKIDELERTIIRLEKDNIWWRTKIFPPMFLIYALILGAGAVFDGVLGVIIYAFLLLILGSYPLAVFADNKSYKERCKKDLEACKKELSNLKLSDLPDYVYV